MTQAQGRAQSQAPPFIRMSGAGKCRRQIGYEILRYPESDPTPNQRLNILELGNAAKLVLLRRLREEGWEVNLTRWACPEPSRKDGGQQLEVRLEESPRVGHPDGRCRHRELTPNLWMLLECKGMNAHQYRRFLQEGFLSSHPQCLGQIAQYGVALHLAGLVTARDAAVVAVLT